MLSKLDRVFLQDANWKSFNRYLAFENCKRDNEQSIDDFLSEFDKRLYLLKECGVQIHDAVLACRLLKSCNLSDVHFQLALSTTKEMTFENVRATLKKLFSDGGITVVSKPTVIQAVKEEPILYSDAYYSTYGSQRRSRDRRMYAGRRGDYRSGRNRGGGMNPVGNDGKITQCFNCGSKMHWSRRCPHVRNVQYDSKGQYTSYEDEEEVQITLMASDVDFDDRVNILLGETFGAMILDLGCSKTVCGRVWFESYLDTLDDDDLQKVKYEASTSVFKFGDGKRKPSLKRVLIPCVLADKNVVISTDIVECNIPLLLSKESMKRAGMVVNTKNDTVLVFGRRLGLFTTSLGHYMLPVVHPPCDAKIERILLSIDDVNTFAVARKLHKQFAHPSSEKLKKFLRNAGQNKPELLESVDKVTNECETCF